MPSIPREPHVEQHNIHRAVLNEFNALLTGGGGLYKKAILLQNGLQRLPNPGFVINDEDGVRHGGKGMKLQASAVIWEATASAAGMRSTNRVPTGELSSTRKVP